MRILAKELQALKAGPGGTLESATEVELKGWVHRVRELGGVSFVMVRDRSGLAQAVVQGKADLSLESVVAITGTPAANEKAPGGVELRASRIDMIARAEPDLPYPVNGDPGKIGLDIILDQRPLSLRNPKIRSIFSVQATIIEAFSSYLRAHGFTEMKTSKLIGSGTEGGTGLFEVDYFDTKVYLAQSPQFYKQMMVASGMERVFEVAPAYRAEKHDTPRHLNEYVSMDVEMAFIDSERDLIALEKELLSSIFEAVASRNGDDLVVWGAVVPGPEAVARSPIVAHDDAIAIAAAELERSGASAKKAYEISPEVERLVCAWSEREHGSDIVFINEFPRRHRPFYTFPLDASRTMSFDAIFRGLEITTGGRRHNDYRAILDVLPKFGLKAEDLADYLSVFKYGCPPHGGFAIGCERLTQKILGLANVKEASLFPRDRKRVRP
ncbi:MAG: aspartate--tRNA(Asn) ligase [Spirochaetae bacterium HGW-Spirochaetae-7]|jgi:nondiscriminating aspartyl-tRNA synthetase|nr:MAG: aspartate--tRNA(Asn) ligase [Spirochaetae bacterium HGW-Spirochaetae-7]